MGSEMCIRDRRITIRREGPIKTYVAEVVRTVKSLWLDGAKFIRRIQCPLEYQLRRWYTGISNAMCPV